ncbi:MAG: hypothetical protein GY795_39230 [Desulfobacterales bacterium]|nr:hypothetical protein [Desulfobacterales bacterium]
MKRIILLSIQLFICPSLLMVYSPVFGDDSTRGIWAFEKSEETRQRIEVLGKVKGKEEFIIAIADNYHRVTGCIADCVTDCKSENIFKLIETEPHDLVDINPEKLGDTYQHFQRNYQKRIELTCNASKDDAFLKTPVYFDIDSEKYYFSTGTDDEFYAVSSDCANSLHATLFGTRERPKEFLPDMNSTVIIELACDEGPLLRDLYGLYRVDRGDIAGKGKPGFVLIIADEQRSGSKKTTYLPIYKVDGNYLKDMTKKDYSRFITTLKNRFDISRDPERKEATFLNNRVLFDFCLDNCGVYQPDHVIFNNGEKTPIGNIPLLLKNHDLFEWKDYYFLGCNDFLAGLGLKQDDKNKDNNRKKRRLRLQELDNLTNLFKCPTLFHTETLSENCTQEDLQALINDVKEERGNATELEIVVSHNISVIGTQPIVIGRQCPYEKVVLRSDKEKVTLIYEKKPSDPENCRDSNWFDLFFVDNGKQLVLSNLTLGFEGSKHPSCRISGFMVHNAGVLFKNFKTQALDRVLLAERSMVECEKSTLSGEEYGMVLKNSNAYIYGTKSDKKMLTIEGKKIVAIHAGQQSHIEIKYATIKGASLVYIGNKTTIDVSDSVLELISEKSEKKLDRQAFVIADAQQNKKRRFSLKIQDSEIKGIPGTDFSMVYYDPTYDGSAVALFDKVVTVANDDDKLPLDDRILKCTGKPGKLFYNGPKNYCR